MREVTFSFDQNFLTAIGGNMHCPNLARTLGYLALWAMPAGDTHGDTSGRYSGRVKIYGDRCGDLHAIYHNAKGEATYNIGGVRRDDGTYSTHS